MWTRSLIGALAALSLVSAAAAQTSPPQGTTPASPPATTAGSSPQFLSEQSANEKITSEVIGLAVYNDQGENVGKVGQLILNQESKVTGAILSVGGILGIGGKAVAVPWKALRFETKDGKNTVVLSMTSEELANAPEYKTQTDMRKEQEAEARRMQQPRGVGGAGGGTTAR